MNFNYEDINVTGPATLARICKEMGVQRLVNFSSINASPKPEVVFPFSDGSRFLKTKYEGELAILSEFPEATIFRCADVYGQDDNFLNFWFSRFRKGMGSDISLYGKVRSLKQLLRFRKCTSTPSKRHVLNTSRGCHFQMK